MASDSLLTDPTGSISDLIPDEESCELLGPTALVVQAVLGVFVVLSLVYKRHREPRKRPWRIWLFDVSKQVVGQMFVHGANIFMSDLVSHHTDGNACVFYFLHILLDTTLGVALIYIILRALTSLFSETFQLKGFESGVYGTPPSFQYWARQAALYVLALTTMKLIVITILIILPGILLIGEWLLSWTRVGSGDSVQVIFTMGIFPIIMNVLQFWLIDSIVKASTKSSVSLDEDVPDVYSSHDREPLFRASEDDDDDYRPTDVERGRHVSRSRSPEGRDKSSSGTTTPEEYKSSGSGPSSSEDPTDHAYPPSLTNSTSSRNTPPKPAKNLLKKANRRPAPAPLSLQTNNPPAVNSPSITPAPHLVPRATVVPQATSIRKVEAVAEPADVWADTWDDSDDWANRVGEEDWTGRRVGQTKDALHTAWSGNAAQIQVGS